MKKIPICPKCGEELDIIYPQKDKKICSFKCGHAIYKIKGQVMVITRRKGG